MKTDNKNSNLDYLDELGSYKVANSDKDVRGWNLQDANGKLIGEVHGLLVNKNIKRVVYLDVKLDKSIIDADYKPYSSKASEGVHDFINEDGENHVIVPIGMATLDLKNEIVVTDQINHNTFAETKRVKKGALIHRDYEAVVLDSYLRNEQHEKYPEDDTLYDRREFNA